MAYFNVHPSMMYMHLYIMHKRHPVSTTDFNRCSGFLTGVDVYTIRPFRFVRQLTIPTSCVTLYSPNSISY